MNFSKNQYFLTSVHSITEIAERLYSNTFISSTLIRTRTDKLFIGEVNEDDFYLMGTSRIGVLCTLNGKIVTDGQQTTLEIETKIHRAFIILFTCWAVFIVVLPLIFYLINPKGSGISPGLLPLLLLVVAGARLLLHFAYTRARNKLIDEIQHIIA